VYIKFQTVSAKVYCQEGNSPDSSVKLRYLQEG